MKHKICLAKKTLIFYSFLAPVIIVGSSYNLIKGVILEENPTILVGAFGLFGFILFPVLLVFTYLHNKCIITTDRMRIGKVDYKFADHDFQITTKEIPFKDRPLFSLFKKKYYDLVIKKTGTNNVVFKKNLDVFQKDIENIKDAFPTEKIKY